MALIEHLERDNWQEALRGFFQYTLEVLRTDRFRHVSSSVDDLRSWLAAGGVRRVKEHLDDQMAIRRFPESRKAAVNEFLDQLVRENRQPLLELMEQGMTVPSFNQHRRHSLDAGEPVRACGDADRP